jgi:hypothetical protein
MGESFFIDSHGVSTSPSVATPELGRFERTCSACGREWLPMQAACTCGSHELTERYHEGTVFERVGGVIRALVVPAKTKAPSATSAQKAAVRGVRDSMSQLLADLKLLDVQLREAVVANVEELEPAHGLVHSALSISGDRSTRRIPGLSLSLESLHAALTTTIENLDEETPK